MGQKNPAIPFKELQEEELVPFDVMVAPCSFEGCPNPDQFLRNRLPIFITSFNILMPISLKAFINIFDQICLDQCTTDTVTTYRNEYNYQTSKNNTALII